jgi:hypothetical protein
LANCDPRFSSGCSQTHSKALSKGTPYLIYPIYCTVLSPFPSPTGRHTHRTFPTFRNQNAGSIACLICMRCDLADHLSDSRPCISHLSYYVLQARGFPRGRRIPKTLAGATDASNSFSVTWRVPRNITHFGCLSTPRAHSSRSSRSDDNRSMFGRSRTRS